MGISHEFDISWSKWPLTAVLVVIKFRHFFTGCGAALRAQIINLRDSNLKLEVTISNVFINDYSEGRFIQTEKVVFRYLKGSSVKAWIKQENSQCLYCLCTGVDFPGLKALFSTFRAADWTNGTKHSSLQQLNVWNGFLICVISEWFGTKWICERGKKKRLEL